MSFSFQAHKDLELVLQFACASNGTPEEDAAIVVRAIDIESQYQAVAVQGKRARIGPRPENRIGALGKRAQHIGVVLVQMWQQVHLVFKQWIGSRCPILGTRYVDTS